MSCLQICLVESAIQSSMLCDCLLYTCLFLSYILWCTNDRMESLKVHLWQLPILISFINDPPIVAKTPRVYNHQIHKRYA